MHKISKIVIFVISPFNKRDFKRFGIDILRSNGFEVFVYDFSPIVYPRLYEIGVSEPSEYEKHFCFVNKCDAIKAIRELENDSFVIFFVWYCKQNFWIYKTFSKNNVPYMLLFSGSLPTCRREEYINTNYSLKNFLKRVSRLTIKKIIKKIVNIPYRHYFARYLGIRAADLVVLAGAETLNFYRKEIIFGKKTEVLYAPSLDYNIFLEMKLPKSRNEANPAIAVYLDLGILNFDSDDLTLEQDPDINMATYFGGINREKQCSNLRNFFNKVEKETGCIVNIAAHPGYDGSSYPDEFGKRLTIVDKTMEMVGRSNFVMNHCSTAVCFAVIFRKPIIFLTLNEDEELFRGKNPEIEHMASWFGKVPINIDDYPIDLDWEKELKINEDLYLNYKNSFLIAKGTEEINSWQIVANRLKLM